MFKHYLLSPLLLFAHFLSFADEKNNSNAEIAYRDTNSTYLQIFVQYADIEEMIKDELNIGFTKSEKKSAYTLVTRKAYDHGQPEIINFNPGHYKIKFDNNGPQNVIIQKDKLNIITLKVTKGKLRFAYINDKKTTVENSATIRNRATYTGITTQKCSEIKEYKAGNYYIEVNTLPPSIFIMDIAYSFTTDINIPKPGKLVIDFPDGVSDVVIYDISGADWKEILHIEKAYTEQNPLLIQPATYIIAWMKNNRRTEKDLIIRAEQVTTISMKE